MSESVQKPRIRFKGFSDAWEQRKLGDTVQITMGQSPDGSTYSDVPSDYILVQGNADLQNGWVSPRLWTSQMTKKADAGDLIMSVRAPAGAMGKTAYNAVIGRGVAAIKGNEFIYQLLVKMDSDGYWKALSCGSTFESLNSDNIKNADVLIPNAAEQKKIGQYFANLDNLITLHQRKYDKLVAVKKALLEKMFPADGETVPKIRFKGFSDAWEQRKVSEMFKVTRGYVLASTLTEAVKSDKKPYPVYSSQTKDNGLMGYYKDYLYEDAITWTTDGANAGTVNYRAGKFYCTNVCGVLLSNEVTANQMIAEALNNVAKGYVSYVGNPKLMNNVMADIEIMIPTQSEEREKLSVLFRNLDNLITLHQCKDFSLKSVFEESKNFISALRKNTSWEQRKLEDFFTERNERSGNGEMISVTIGSGIKKFDELNRFDKKPDDLSKYKRVEVGDIAYNSMRMWQGASGYSPYSGILSPAYTVITPKNGVSSRFFAYVLKQPKMIHQFEINSQGLTKDTWNLKFPAFAPIEVVAPLQLAEQEKVSELLLQLDNLITLHQRIKINITGDYHDKKDK